MEERHEKISNSQLLFRNFLAILTLCGLVFPTGLVARAAASLSVTPITWNIIGLDSNNVNVGPNHFPIGVRVCNTGDSAATNVSASFVWDSANSYINIRPGTNSTLLVASIPATDPDTCEDFYFEVEVTRDANAYDTVRRYHIEVTADGLGIISTPTPRELFVEHLISQSRNAVTDIQLSQDGVAYTSIPNGGSMTLVKGSTYWIKLVAGTATNGYEQIETFINFPNTIFQIQAVTSTYSADSSPRVDNPDTRLYGDGCLWENNPLSPNYRACLDSGKAGGNVTITYKVKIIAVPSSPLVNPEPLSTLIYDFSGSSFHYNADFGVSVRYANVVNATLAKSFLPSTINPGDVSTLQFTITNPGPQAISNVSFTDDLPTGVAVSGTSVTYNGCGSSPSPTSLTNGQTSLSFSNITVSGLSDCTISLSVTASIDGTYNNVSGHLYIDGDDTGSYAEDTLIVSSKPAPPASCPVGDRVTLATWTMPTSGQGSGGPPPPYTTKAADVSTVTASSAGGTPSIPSAGNPANSWQISGDWQNVALPITENTVPYFRFVLDTSNYGQVGISFDYDLEGNGNWANPGDNRYTIFTRPDSGAWSSSGEQIAAKGSWTSVANYNAPTTGSSTTTFQITFRGGKDAGAYVRLDNITFTGCPRPVPPTLSKSFAPSSILQGASSTLTFTFSNPNASPLSGIAFTDDLPAGLVVATPNNLTAITCSSGSVLTLPTITAVAGSTTITMTGLQLAANSTCSFSVDVQGNVAGTHINVTDPISATSTGPNTTGGANVGYGQSDLTVIAPPVIGKVFGASSLITGNTTSLTFSLSNPNPAVTLTGVQFTDNLPAGLVVATPNGLSSVTCDPPGSMTGYTISAVAGSSTISLSGASLTAGAFCTFSLNVTGITTGLKENNVTISSTNGGTGNTATASVLVKDLTPALKLLKQIGTSPSGPWYTSLIIVPGSAVYYRFVVENTGDVPLTGIYITDPNVNTSACSWPNPLPVADADDNHIAVCVVGPVTALAGYYPNTATAHGSYLGSEYDSPASTASYMNGNFGHLPYSTYKYANVFNEGGAFHVNGTTYLGTRLPSLNADPPETDGSQSNTYQFEATDDGIFFLPGWGSGSGYISATVTCPASPCYLYAWFDWSQDGDFDDAYETANWTVTQGVQVLSFSYAASGSLPNGIYYMRFRIYPVQPANPQYYGIAKDAGGNYLVGEIEDEFYDPAHPNAVTLAWLGARPATPSWGWQLAGLAFLLVSGLAVGASLRRWQRKRLG